MKAILPPRQVLKFANAGHPRIQELAHGLTENALLDDDKVSRILEYVRDEIPFGFPPRWNEDTATDVLDVGIGYCITKSILFQALCLAAGIPARIHFAHIRTKAMRGIFPFWAFLFLPRAGTHAWVDVELGENWIPVDAYINDLPLFMAARRRLEKEGRQIGYSVACKKEAPCGADWRKAFHQMGAVVEDHGSWEDASQYFNSEHYCPVAPWRQLFYPILRRLSNRAVERLRVGG